MDNDIPLIVAALIAVGIIVIGCFYLLSPERISGTPHTVTTIRPRRNGMFSQFVRPCDLCKRDSFPDFKPRPSRLQRTSFNPPVAAALASAGKSSLPRKNTRMFLKTMSQNGIFGRRFVSGVSADRALRHCISQYSASPHPGSRQANRRIVSLSDALKTRESAGPAAIGPADHQDAAQ
jgi:hypothetical protein